LPPEKALAHEPVHVGQTQKPVPITVMPDKDLEATAIVLRYRAATSYAFTDVPMKKGPTGAFEAAIPASATDGEQVVYFIEARRSNGSVVVGRGTAADPIVVALARPAPAVMAAATATGTATGGSPHAEADKRFYFALVGGTGLGWASGSGETTLNPVLSSGVGWTHSGQLAPEFGYFLTSRLMLGVQMRLQLVKGATPYHVPDPKPNECGTMEHVCDPASGAIAGVLKMTFFLTDPSSSFRPYLSLSAGGGTIRNVSRVMGPDACGSGSEPCVDTVGGGPVLVGPGLGFRYMVSDAVGVVAGVNGLVGVPKFTATADVNVGLSFNF
jgi:hypothetical protein